MRGQPEEAWTHGRVVSLSCHSTARSISFTHLTGSLRGHSDNRVDSAEVARSQRYRKPNVLALRLTPTRLQRVSRSPWKNSSKAGHATACRVRLSARHPDWPQRTACLPRLIAVDILPGQGAKLQFSRPPEINEARLLAREDVLAG